MVKRGHPCQSPAPRSEHGFNELFFFFGFNFLFLLPQHLKMYYYLSVCGI